MTAVPHIPVMLAEVLDTLEPRKGGRYVDATFGAGGYSAAILNRADCTVTGIDRDPRTVAAARKIVENFAPRLTLVLGRFGETEALVQGPIDGIAFDLGVSSMQIDESERGFSFRFDGPLDMRMSAEGKSAADLINNASESDLADIIFLYGEERHARRIAREIVRVRMLAPFATTLQLAETVRRVTPGKKNEIDPATRTFQAIRIAVNDELAQLESGLVAAEKLLSPGGRLVVVTFHSLEDRVVKAFLKARCGDAAAPSRHMPAAADQQPASFRLLTKKPIAPGDAEVQSNPRARSAKLRAAERTDAPVWRIAA